MPELWPVSLFVILYLESLPHLEGLAMSENSSTKIDLKTVGAIIGVVGALAAAAGSWYVNSYRLDQLEKDQVKIVEGIQDVKCLVAQVHEIPLPECK